MMLRRRLPSGKEQLVWGSLSLLVLLCCLYYGYVACIPALDFDLASSGRVLSAAACAEPGRCIQVDDQVLAFGDVEYQEFKRSRWMDLLDFFDADGTALVRVLRNGQALTVEAYSHGGLRALLSDDTFIASLFPLVFWLMGAVTVLFLRPRDERWLVLVLFSYVTALWFSSGLVSWRHTGGSFVVFRVFIWLFLPLAVHLHAIVPNVALKRRQWLLVPLYATALLLIVLDAAGLLEAFNRPYLWPFLLGILLSLGLLLLRFFLPVDAGARLANRTMLFGVVFGFGPILTFLFVIPGIVSSLPMPVDDASFEPLGIALSLIAIPIMPMCYLYAIYKHHLGTFEFRANRLLGTYSFFPLYVTLLLMTLLPVSGRWAVTSQQFLIATLAVAVAFVSAAPFLRSRFQTLMDRHVFGIRHTPEEVIGMVSERITTAFDRAVLVELIVDEILPTLLIRQSALYLFGPPQREALYEHGLPAELPAPDERALGELLAASGRYLDPQAGSPPACPWVRLVLPLTLQGETLGVWLIGRRDPDDFFPASDIHLLSTIANQVAAMLENIRLYEQAQQEILQRKSAEQEIRRSEERFRNLFEATLEGIALVKSGMILEVNHALLAIFGHSSPADLIGRRLSELVSEGEATLCEEPREGFGSHRDGSRVDLELAGKKFVYQGEDVTVVAIRDITRRKRDEAENKMLQRQLLHSQKMEAIGRLSAGVAHDFNNCLLAIFGYSDMLLARYRGDDPLYRNLTGIKDASQKAAALTKQLLTFARRQPLETKVMDLNLVVAGLEKMLRRLIGEDIDLATELHPQLDKVKIDPGQMEQVLLNLAVNARHAMPDGGRLVIRTAPLAVAEGRPAPHRDVPPGSYVVLTVQDTGVGMDADVLSRIFEPFFTTKEVGVGTGLGLSTAYGIVKQSGGHIFVDSALGKGACFAIYLPASDEETVAPSPAAGLAADQGVETILLVEDEQEVRAMLHQVLLGKGYRVLQAGSGEEALAMAGRHPGAIHLLLTDVIMPQMKGPDLAARLLAARPRTRVLYMSGYNEEALPGTAAPATICLEKPFSPHTLAQTVRAVLDAPETTQAAAVV
jgi:PAS domain S-box-containing protein